MDVTKDSPDIVDQKINQLKKIIPECFTEGKIDFEKLKNTLGEIQDSEEKYTFNWAGRNETFKNIQTTSKGTLSPNFKKSINFDDTKNIFIEGDNLEVLKLLQKTYFEQIKMIYIDPPYNTGKDFIYKDNFHEGLDTYLEQTGQKDKGITLTSNPETSGRYHSDWISMMYARLYLARNLLKKEGIIFVSLDDHEDYHLRIIMNAIFGEENFVAKLVWNHEGHTDNQFHIKINHEYILVYVKDYEKKESAISRVIDPNTRPESNLWKGYAENSITKNGPKNPASEITLPKGFPCESDKLSLEAHDIPTGFLSELKEQKYISRKMTKKYNLEYPIRKESIEIKNKELVKETKLLSGWANIDKLKQFIKNDFEPIQEENGKLSFYISKKGVIYYRRDERKARNIVSVLRNLGTTEQANSELEDMEIIYQNQYPKPIPLMKYLISIGTDQEDDIILDFFAGSGTTAEAMFEQFYIDKIKRRFICIQLPEKILDDGIQQHETISELCISRIKQVITKLDEKQKTRDTKQDLGFKIFTLTKSNFKIWENYDGKNEEELKKQISLFESPLISKYDDQNVFYECIIKEGLDLNSKIEKLPIDTNQIYKISDENNIFFITLEKEIKPKTVDALNLTKENIFICIDASLNDTQKINLAKQSILKIL